MSTIKVSRFTAFEFTPEEELQASTFTALQKQFIQTQIAVLANNKVEMKYDPEHPTEFLQQEAESHGAIQALEFLLITSIESEEAMLDIIQQQAELDKKAGRDFEA